MFLCKHVSILVEAGHFAVQQHERESMAIVSDDRSYIEFVLGTMGAIEYQESVW
jgi:hypothetical protein